MSPLALRRTIGQLLIAGFHGQQIPSELKEIAREWSLGGVILFARNISEPEALAELCHEAARLVPQVPLWVSMDQEGGRVARLKPPFTEWPPMATLGRSGDAALAERFARAAASEMRAVGITLDYAPVLDIWTNRANRVIGDRALAETAADVARLGAVIVRAMQEEGVAACGKHFPGHGDTVADSHEELPLVEQPPERLREVEFEPFRAAIAAGVASIMTAHVFVPSLDETQPATLSRRVVGDILRRELGFEGVIISDDLEMKAISKDIPIPSAAVRAIGAGCDAILLCNEGPALQHAALEALVYAVENETLSLSRVEDALKRQQRAKERFLGASVAMRPPTGKRLRQLIGTDEHQAIADEMARFA